MDDPLAFLNFFKICFVFVLNLFLLLHEEVRADPFTTQFFRFFYFFLYHILFYLQYLGGKKKKKKNVAFFAVFFFFFLEKKIFFREQKRIWYRGYQGIWKNGAIFFKLHTHKEWQICGNIEILFFGKSPWFLRKCESISIASMHTCCPKPT